MKVSLEENGKYLGKVNYTDNLDRWDGRNFTCGSTGHHLGVGKTKSGKFFRVDGTNWQGERDSASVISEDKARQLVLAHSDDVLFEELFGEPIPSLD